MLSTGVSFVLFVGDWMALIAFASVVNCGAWYFIIVTSFLISDIAGNWLTILSVGDEGHHCAQAIPLDLGRKRATAVRCNTCWTYDRGVQHPWFSYSQSTYVEADSR
jgi:hypothetical protein